MIADAVLYVVLNLDENLAPVPRYIVVHYFGVQHLDTTSGALELHQYQYYDRGILDDCIGILI